MKVNICTWVVFIMWKVQISKISNYLDSFILRSETRQWMSALIFLFSPVLVR